MTRESNFSSFCKLPAEIRIMIWDYSLPESRVCEVLDAPNVTRRTNPMAGLMFANVQQEPPPALAAVCRESRYLVLHHYKPLTLGATTKYVDLSRDILLLEPYLQIKRLHRTLHFMSQIPLVRDHINRLALGTSYGIHTGICHPVMNRKTSKTNVSKLLASLARFPKLKTLIFIVHREFQFEVVLQHQGQDPLPATRSHVPLQPVSSNTGTTSGHPLFNTNPRNPLPPPTTTLMPFSLPSPWQQQLPPSLPPLPPLPPHSQQFLPQETHQAYCSNLDIVSDVRHTRPCRPDKSELLYYPLEYDEDLDLNDEEEERGGAWCDTWPTNDDWRRFRRRWVRGVRMAGEDGQDERERCEYGMVGGGAGCKRSVTEAFGEEDRDRRGRKQVRPAVPAIKGASLLWRSAKGGYV
jgi:hypothetical protein